MNDKTRADILDRVAAFIGTDPLEGMHNWIKDPNFKGLNPPEWWGDMQDPGVIDKMKTSEATLSLENIRSFNELIENQIAKENAILHATGSEGKAVPLEGETKEGSSQKAPMAPKIFGDKI